MKPKLETYNTSDKIEPKLESETIKLFKEEREVYKQYWHFLCKMSQEKPVKLSRDLFKHIPIGAYYMDDKRQIYRKLTKTRHEKVVGYSMRSGFLWQEGTLKYIGKDFKWIFDASINQLYRNPAYLVSEEEKAKNDQLIEQRNKQEAQIREKIVNFLRLHPNATLETVSEGTELHVGTVRSHMTDLGVLEAPKCEALRTLDLKEKKETGRAINVKTTRNNSFIKLLIQFLTKILQKLV